MLCTIFKRAGIDAEIIYFKEANIFAYKSGDVISVRRIEN
jgi:hypothetical protein